MQAYQLGLVEALSSMASGQLTAQAYAESCIARTLAVEPTVGAFAWFDAQAFRAAAAGHSAGTGALTGIPVGLKDIIATRGVPTENGSAAFKGHVPAQSAWVADALSAAGAILFGKTVTTEFAWRQPGKTRNPWNLGHTPGGSSSGSAAAVACGCVPAALGTQTLGSVVRPAAYCGVVGFKPSFGLIPRTGVYALASSLDHIGVMTRSVADAAYLASVLTGRDGIDFHGTPVPPAAWPLAKSGKPPRLALVHTAAWDRVSAEQRALVADTARRLEAAGASVSVLKLPAHFEQLWAVAKTICDAEGGLVNAALALETPPRISQHSLDLVARGHAITAMAYLKARQDQQTLIRDYAALMAPFDAALTAPALGEAPAGLEDTGDAVFCTPFTLVGAPAINLPAGRSENGLPLGVQLAGRWGEDRALLEAAAWVEQEIGYSVGFPLI